MAAGNPAIIKDFSSEYGCACMQPDAHSHAVKVELSYKGKYYAAAPDTDYRLNGINGDEYADKRGAVPPQQSTRCRQSGGRAGHAVYRGGGCDYAADSNPCFYSLLVKHQILNDFYFQAAF